MVTFSKYLQDKSLVVSEDTGIEKNIKQENQVVSHNLCYTQSPWPRS
jgi:hypothetical protein